MSKLIQLNTKPDCVIEFRVMDKEGHLEVIYHNKAASALLVYTPDKQIYSANVRPLTTLNHFKSSNEAKKYIINTIKNQCENCA
jgi:hypothetical protein